MRVYTPPTVETSAVVRAMQRFRTAADRARPGGLHLSTVTDDMLRLMYPKMFRGTFEPEQMINYQEIGNCFEYCIAQAFMQLYGPNWQWHPEPRKQDGMWCSPDGLLHDSVVEIKACWSSLRTFLDLDDDNEPVRPSDKFMSYVLRTLGYMKVYGKRRGILIVWFVNGEYPQGPPAPVWPRTFYLRPSAAEIDHNWFRIVQHVDDQGMLDA